MAPLLSPPNNVVYSPVLLGHHNRFKGLTHPVDLHPVLRLLLGLLGVCTREQQPKIPISRVIQECVAAKVASNRRRSYTKGLESYFRLFTRGREDWAIDSVTVGDIEEWFIGRREAPSSRAANLGRLSALFSFAHRRGYVTENPCDRVERVRIDRLPPRILSPSEARRIMLATVRREPAMVGYITLGLYAGIRPEELERLRWADVDLDRGLVNINASASKVHKRRVVHLHPKAVAWLRRGAWPISGMIAPGSVRRRRRRISKEAGIEWPQDLLRHTASSYMLQLFRDVGKVSMELGNSSGIVLRHYFEIVSDRACSRFWKYRFDRRPTSP